MLSLPLCVLSMFLLIFDAKNAIEGAKEGIILCLYTVIPSLFPYCVLSILFRSMIAGQPLRIMRPAERFLQIPEGFGTILLLGLLGGYPIGAICTEKAVKDKTFLPEDVKYLRAFANNAGPSFMLGITACYFSQKNYALMLMLIQILSSLMCCMLLSGRQPNGYCAKSPAKVNITDAIKQGCSAMMNVCGIIILFRAFMNILNRYLLLLVSPKAGAVIAGILELTNGITLLPALQRESLMFIAAAGMLTFGGLCVAMQTVSLSSPGAAKYYFIGKLLQTTVSVLLAIIYFYLKELSVFAYIAMFIILKLLRSAVNNKHFLIKNSGNLDINHV